MSRPAEGNDGQPRKRARALYLKQVHLELAAALVVICVVLAASGWSLRPQSNGFPTVPQNLSIQVSRSPITAEETLTRTSSNGAMLEVHVDEGAPPGGPLPVVEGAHLSDSGWTVVVYNPGTARLCTPDTYVSGGAGAISEAVVPPQHFARGSVVRTPVAVVQGSQDPIYVRLCWSSDGPVSLDGSYLSARFPPLAASPTNVVNTNEPYLDASVAHDLHANAGDTANFAVQQSPSPFSNSTLDSWRWTNQNDLLPVRLAAIDVSAQQHDTYRAFLSGIALGVAGAALVSLIVEIVAPLSRRRDAKW